MKPEKERAAKEIFSETTINITTEGRKQIGAALGSRDFCEEYVDEKVEEWVAQVTRPLERAIADLLVPAITSPSMLPHRKNGTF